MNQLFRVFLSCKQPPLTSPEWPYTSQSPLLFSNREAQIFGYHSVLWKISSTNLPLSCTLCRTSNSPWDRDTTQSMKRRRRSRECPSMRPLHQTTWLYSPRSLPINIMSYTKSIWSRCYLQRNNQKSSRGSNRSMRDMFRKVKRWVI